MDINIGETPAGRIKMELFSDIVPKSVNVSPLYFPQNLMVYLIGQQRIFGSYVLANTGKLTILITMIML